MSQFSLKKVSLCTNQQFADAWSSQGYYCEEGTYPTSEKQCPAGTYRDTRGARSVEDCIPCSGGKACTIPGLPNPDEGKECNSEVFPINCSLH